MTRDLKKQYECLQYATCLEMLKTHFSQFGEIVDCVVPKDPKTKFAKGFGFVTFTRGKAVDDVMANRPHKVLHNPIYLILFSPICPNLKSFKYVGQISKSMIRIDCPITIHNRASSYIC